MSKRYGTNNEPVLGEKRWEEIRWLLHVRWRILVTYAETGPEEVMVRNMLRDWFFDTLDELAGDYDLSLN